jgi:hypothetical protein
MNFDESPDVMSILREQVLPRLPLALIALIIVGNGIYAGMTVLPKWVEWSELVEQEHELDTQLAEMAEAELDTPEILQAQIDNIEADMVSLRQTFLNPIQPDTVINTLYNNADETNVIIVKLQSVEPDPTLALAPYQRQTFQLEVQASDLLYLFNFIIALEEADLPSVSIQNLHIAEEDGLPQMTLTLHLYTMEGVPSTDFEQLARQDLLVVSSAPVVFDTPQSSVPDAELIKNVQTPTPIPTLPPPTPTATPTEVFCPEAPPSLIEHGGTVIVNFDGAGALRVLLDVRGGATSTLLQVYDGDILTVLSGPMCASWMQETILYWYVEFDGKRGWVGEGSSQTRWLCPVDEPTCS